ncbi:hypothetical protein MOTT12_01480 [Mycobacterium intracellulare subsp. yongonense]|nr:hypothetical protein MOTT12_01480 [Mycobacterium intracellulare subsp. yongonense]
MQVWAWRDGSAWRRRSRTRATRFRTRAQPPMAISIFGNVNFARR